MQRPSSAALLKDLEEIVERKDKEGPAPSLGGIRTPAQSSIAFTLPFSTDAHLHEQYRSAYGMLRMGLFLEDLDMTAGFLGFLHSDDGLTTTRPLVIVTASVQRILLLNPIRLSRDLHVSGRVVYTGRSSMLCMIEMSQDNPDQPGEHLPLMNAYFTMVGLDSKTRKAVEVNKIRPASELDRLHHQKAVDIIRTNKQAEAEHLTKKPPSAPELQLIHDFFLSPPDNSIQMEKTKQQSLLICHPQDRNLHGKIFGGFLMRQAFELGWATAFAAMGTRPFFLAIDDIQFVKPVDIGSLLTFTAVLTYVSPSKKSAVVRVSAEVSQPANGTKAELTNTFHFIFTYPDQKTPLPIVRPTTYSEAIFHLQGKRIYDSCFAVAQRDGSTLMDYF